MLIFSWPRSQPPCERAPAGVGALPGGRSLDVVGPDAERTGQAAGPRPQLAACDGLNARLGVDKAQQQFGGFVGAPLADVLQGNAGNRARDPLVAVRDLE